MKTFIVIFVFLCFSLVGCSNTNNNENSNTSITRLSADVNQTQQKTEEQMSTFSTKILQDNSSRQKNIELGCEELNGSIVKAGETFSFCDTVGQATPEKGYEKAEIFDSEGNTIMGYGGGKCQISSTLYNAVLAVPTLSVIERYPHSKRVYYVEEGKDATVSYGSVDFKFRNDNNYDIRIDASGVNDTLTITLFKI